MPGVKAVLLAEIRNLYHVQHVSMREIAAMTGISLGRVKVIVETPPKEDT